MNRLLGTATILFALGLSAAIRAQQLTVVAVSHQTDEYDYTITTPQNSNTNCSVNDSSVNCNTTSYGGGTQAHAFVPLVSSCHVKRSWAVDSIQTDKNGKMALELTDWLTEGEPFPAEIKDKHMYITCRRGGNQGKKETLKYDILDIRPVQ